MATSKKPTTNKTKSTQTNSYTPSKSVIKVIDSKTGKPYMYDKTYDAIFDTNGNQLDSDDFRHIKELTKVSPKKDHATVVAEKKKELREKGITSEYAAYYKPGDSEKALSIIDYSAGYLDYTMADKDLLDSDMAIENAKKLKVESQLNDKDRALKKGTILKGVDIPLLWSLGMPAKGRFPGMTTRGSWDISDYRPTRGSENFPYYFTPLGKTYNTLEEKENRNAIIDTTIMTALRDYRSDPVKYANTSMEMYDISNRLGNLGSYGMSLAPDSSYLSLHDKWDLDPNASGHMPKFAPDFVYSAGLTELGIPKKDHARMIKDFKAGKSVTEIAGFAPTVPVYDRIYENSKGQSIKDILKEMQNANPISSNNINTAAPKNQDRYKYENKSEKFTSGGTTETQPVLPKKVVKLAGKYVEAYIDTNKKPIFATSNEIDNSKIRKTTLGDEYDLEGTTYLLNSEEPITTNPVKPTPVVGNTASVTNKVSETIITKPTVTLSNNNNLIETSINKPNNPVIDVKAPVIKSKKEVVNLQDFLNGTLGIKLLTDGVLGNKTKEAISKYANDYESTAYLRDTYPSLINYFPKLKEEVKVNNEEIKAFQKSLGISDITGTVTPETIQTYEKLIIDGFNTSTDTPVNTKSKTKIDPNNANKEIVTTTSDEFSDMIKRFIINTPEAIRQKSSVVAISRLGIPGKSAEEINRNFAKIYLQNPTDKTYRNVVSRFPVLQQYINEEKSKSTNSYAYGGYSKRFI